VKAGGKQSNRIILSLTPALTLVPSSEYFFDPEDGGNMFLRIVSLLSTEFTALYP
jgi:hypothetical protein